jgi:hypothetical protein
MIAANGSVRTVQVTDSQTVDFDIASDMPDDILAAAPAHVWQDRGREILPLPPANAVSFRRQQRSNLRAVFYVLYLVLLSLPIVCPCYHTST